MYMYRVYTRVQAQGTLLVSNSIDIRMSTHDYISNGTKLTVFSSLRESKLRCTNRYAAAY